MLFDPRAEARAGLRTLCHMVPAIGSVHETASGQELLAAYSRHPADVVIVGTQRGTSYGTEAVRGLLEQDGGVRVIAFGSPDDTTMIASMFALGCRGILPWSATEVDLVVMLASIVVVRPRPVDLSRREFQVLQGLGDGLTNSQIAERINRSEETVKVHLRRLFRKLSARDRAHAVGIGVRSGLIR